MHLEHIQCDNAPEIALHFKEEEETDRLMLLRKSFIKSERGSDLKPTPREQ